MRSNPRQKCFAWRQSIRDRWRGLCKRRMVLQRNLIVAKVDLIFPHWTEILIFLSYTRVLVTCYNQTIEQFFVLEAIFIFDIFIHLSTTLGHQRKLFMQTQRIQCHRYHCYRLAWSRLARYRLDSQLQLDSGDWPLLLLLDNLVLGILQRGVGFRSMLGCTMGGAGRSPTVASSRCDGLEEYSCRYGTLEPNRQQGLF